MKPSRLTGRLEALLKPAEDEDNRRPLSAVASACTTKERRFAEAYVELGGAHGAGSAAARKAGYGNQGSTANVYASIADRELNKDVVIAYIAELAKRKIRSLVPAAVNAVREIIDDRAHKDRLKASMAAIERVDPVETKHNIEVTHVVNHDQDAIAVLRHLKAIGAPREMLEANFGFTGLSRYERLLAAEDMAKGGKTIEGELAAATASFDDWLGE
jgi:phage terminase small subunit